MYIEFFGLQALPFNLTPDPAFLFLPPKHREALNGLSYAIVERKGFVVLTGDAGTGKTTLLNAVLSHLPETRVLTSVILNPTLTPGEFLENVLLDFGIPNVPSSKAQRLWMMQDFLARARRENQIVVTIIDEAHKLSVDVLEEIRLLGNYEFGPDKFLQIVLLGQCELDQVLNRHELRQLKQRIALRLYIDPLGVAEIEEYIALRWSRASGRSTTHPFTPDAIAGIVRWSRGIPRLINSICDTSLLMAYGDAIRVVGGNYVRAAAANLMLLETHEETPPSEIPVLVNGGASDDSLEKRIPQPAPPANTISTAISDDHRIPTFASYGRARSNPSLLRRIAGRFGLPR